VWSVVLPTAMSGMITASLLGIAIAVGETAPLLFTAFGNNDMNVNPLHGAQQALPLLLLHLVTTPEASLVNLAYATAFILLALVLILFVLARLLGRPRTKSGVWRARLRSMRQRPPRTDGGQAGGELRPKPGPFITAQPPPRP
jgi:phosphate transport system permease protein